MIQIQNLTKNFGSRTVVDNLSFEVRPGVVTGFLGPNGAGKSTTMRMILGLDRPTSGQALIDGMRYRDLPRPLTMVGALLDARWVHGQRTARAHLAWLAASNEMPRRRVDEVLDLVGLTDVAGKKAGSFSLGMSQRLGLAVALLGDPRCDPGVNRGASAPGRRASRALPATWQRHARHHRQSLHER